MHLGSLILLNVRESVREVHFDVFTCSINYRLVAIKFETKLLYDSDKIMRVYISHLKEVIISNFLTQHNIKRCQKNFRVI